VSSFFRVKNWTIIQRLRATLALLILLSLFGTLLLLGLEKRVSAIRSLGDGALIVAEQIRYDTLERSDALRALLMDPKNTLEKKRADDADADQGKIVDAVKPELGNRLELVRALDDIMDLNTRTLDPLAARIESQAETDVSAATTDYLTNYLTARRHEEKQVDDFAALVRTSNEQQIAHCQVYQVAGMAIMLVILIVCVLLGQRLSQAITQPLGRLLGAIQQMGSGDFSSRLALERQDEFGTLAGGFDRMGDELTTLIGRVQESGIRVNQSITEMAATLRQQQATTKEVAATTQEIGATSKEISATSKTLVGTMGEVVQVAEQTGRSAGSGQAGLDRMAKTMQGITAASATVAEKLAVLNEKAGRINGVVTTINKVADQTNLLSLNAAIEAEKAGEYGLGFAVVAREIRRLADQTAVATYDIERMVKEMESAVNAGVMGMERFSEEVRRGVEDVRDVGGQLTQIIGQVQELTPRFEAVSEGMQSQAAAAQQISESLVQLSEATQQTAESIEQSNGVINQLGESARGLHEGVARFKVKATPLAALV
jgi:methyl-accepting chemotaxis protein WspA